MNYHLSWARGDRFGPCHMSAWNLGSLIDLGWSDYRIAHYFGVEQSRVSGLRAYYGLKSARTAETRASA